MFLCRLSSNLHSPFIHVHLLLQWRLVLSHTAKRSLRAHLTNGCAARGVLGGGPGGWRQRAEGIGQLGDINGSPRWEIAQNFLLDTVVKFKYANNIYFHGEWEETGLKGAERLRWAQGPWLGVKGQQPKDVCHAELEH